MELGGNLPDTLIEHAMLASAEPIVIATVDNEHVDSAESNLKMKNEPIETIEEQVEAEEEQPLKAASGQ